MEKQLDTIAKSYDKTIELGRKGIDLYENLPEYIINNPDYLIYKKEVENGFVVVKIKKLKNF